MDATQRFCEVCGASTPHALRSEHGHRATYAGLAAGIAAGSLTNLYETFLVENGFPHGREPSERAYLAISTVALHAVDHVDNHCAAASWARGKRGRDELYCLHAAVLLACLHDAIPDFAGEATRRARIPLTSISTRLVHRRLPPRGLVASRLDYYADKIDVERSLFTSAVRAFFDVSDGRIEMPTEILMDGAMLTPEQALVGDLVPLAGTLLQITRMLLLKDLDS